MGSRRQPNTAGLRCLVVYAEIFLGSVVVVEAVVEAVVAAGVVAAGAAVAAVASRREEGCQVRERESVRPR